MSFIALLFQGATTFSCGMNNCTNGMMMTCHDLHSVDQARVVQNVDSDIHRINLYPVK